MTSQTTVFLVMGVAIIASSHWMALFIAWNAKRNANWELSKRGLQILFVVIGVGVIVMGLLGGQ